MTFDERRYTKQKLPIAVSHCHRTIQSIRQATQDPTNPHGAWHAALLSIDFRRQIVDQHIRLSSRLTVQTGPFAGMRYVAGAAGSLYSPKILGSYEQELHPYIWALPNYRYFVNVGCAEGYYAVGAKMLAPDIEVFAFDIDPAALAKCRELAAVNGVTNGLQLEAECTTGRLAELARPGSLVMLDIEGAEVALLEGLPSEKAAQCDFLIETHNVGTGMTLGAVVAAFAGTHEITIVDQQPRDWQIYPELHGLGQLDRFLAQWEGRGPEPWVFAKTRSTARPGGG